MRNIKKQLLGAIGVLAVVGSSMFAAVPAYAQNQDPVVGANTTKQVVVDKEIGDVLLQGAVIAVVNGVNYVAQQLAYSFAVSLTSECPGQKVCWDSKPLRSGLTQAWQGAIGEAVGSLNQELGLGKYGLNLCNPDPRFLLQIQLGLLDELKPPAPKCDFNDIIANYEQLGEEIGSGEFLDRFKVSFTPGQAPVSVSLNVLNGLYSQRQDAEKIEVLKRINDAAAGGGFTDLRDPVSGRVTAPAEVVRDRFAAGQRAKEKGAEGVNQIVAGQIASRAAASVAINAAQTFAQTLIARLWNRFAEGLLSTEELVANQPDLVLNAEGLLNPGRAAISQALAPRFTNIAAQPRETGVVDTILVFSSCPNQGRQPMNCVMDAQFAQAVRQADLLQSLTVREAIKKNLLHGEWKLVSSGANPVVDSDPFCYTHAYCESNLKKLRAARVIPVGWEMAAAKASDRTTLAEVVAGFEVCNDDGNPDDEHPWCHLIDPDWVLRVPLTQCKATVNGNFLLSSDIATRMEACVDTQTCLKQDDAGNCIGGYGYCTKEKRVWRFNGQSCPAQFASCAQFTGADGDPVGLLSSTIDQGVCNASNAGCSEYSLTRTVTAQGIGGDPATKADDWSQNFTHFNGTIRSCDPANDGCQALYPLAGSTLNLIRNGGFEELEAVQQDENVLHPNHWGPYAQPAAGAHGFVSRDGSKAASGSNAVLLTGAADTVLQDDLTVPGGNTYTFSAALVPSSGTTATAYFDVFFRGNDSSWISLPAGSFSTTTGSSGFSGTPTITVSSPVRSLAGNVSGLRVAVSGTVSGNFGRVWMTFASTNKSLQYARVYAGQNAGDADTYVDELMLENGGAPGAFHEGYGGQVRTIHAKVAPEYLGCTGDATDRIECDNFAPICRATEVGCDAYTPTNGDAMVPGVVAAQDRCPAACAGYDTFKQEASTFEGEKFPEYFIPATARACSATEVGCSQFTDVETEAVAYAASLRACVKSDDPTVDAFYSWEGSDTTGYQLRLWNFKTTDGSVVMNDSNDVCAESGTCVPTPAPCTALDGDSGACESRSASNASGSTYGLCTRADVDAGDLDCREFYDASGNRHFRKLSTTVVASAQCRQYRITASTQADCVASNGRWDAAATRCVYVADLTQSITCEAAANGCRAYKGNAATNVRTIVNEDFETGLDGWRDRSGDYSDIEQSSESVTVGGHSLKLKDDGGEDERALLALDSAVQGGRSYSLSLWARGSGTLEASLRVGDAGALIGAFSDDDGATTKIPSLALSSEWRKFDLGPVFVAQTPVGGLADLFLNPRGVCVGGSTTGTMCTDDSQCSGGSTCSGPSEVFIDNITIKEVQDSISVVRGSWSTPASCDQDSTGAPSPQEMLGCREYKTRLGGTEFLRSFSRICREKAIGCAAYAKTEYTTADPYGSTKLAVCNGSTGQACDYTMPDGSALEDVCTVPAGETSCRFSLAGAIDATSGTHADRVKLSGDSAVYLAVRAKDRCPATQESCRAMGVPVYQYDTNGDKSVKEWKEGAYIYDAAKFDTLLCRAAEVSCKAYKSTGGTAYFKDPGDRLCEYRENVAVDTNADGTNEGLQDKAGWFMAGKSSNVPCPGSVLQQGTNYRIAKSGDASYARWTGTCDAQFDRCQEFIDPQDTSDANPKGQPYYYIEDSRLSAASCNGQVSLDRGCVLFDKTSNPLKLYDANATYAASRQVGGDPVPPVSSGTKTANLILQVRIDRECTEWLTCTSSEVTFDTDSNQYRRRCSTIASCRGNVGQSSNFYECSDVRTETPQRLNAIKYSERAGDDQKVDWNDEEYSGFSVGGAYPASAVSLYTVVGGGSCVTKKDATCVPAPGRACGRSCDLDADCPSGQACIVNDGVCSDDANVSCADDAQCKNGFCDTSYLATRRFAVQVDPGAECSVDADCPDARFGDPGRCISGRCFYDYVGGSFSPQPVQCRAYPEKDSPYGAGAVNANAPEVKNGGYDAGGNAIAKKPEFAGANICAQGQTCECSYKRVKYGASQNRFVGFSGSYPIGICSGGPNEGLPCDPARPDAPGSDAHWACQSSKGGTCKLPTEVSVLNGWVGACLDRDPSRLVGGVSNWQSCNLWLPVDQLIGAPDISNLHTEAGYTTQSDTLYCAVGRGAIDGSYSATLSTSIGGGPGNTVQRIADGDGNNDTYRHDVVGDYLQKDISHITVHAEGWSGPGAHRNADFHLLPGNGWYATVEFGEDNGSCESSGDTMFCNGTYWHSKAGCTTGGHLCPRAEWDANGRLTNFSTEYKNTDEDGDTPQVDLTFTVHYRDSCSVVAGVTDLTQAGPESSSNVAWTDRAAFGGPSLTYDFAHQSTRTVEGVASAQKPYGAIQQPATTASGYVTFNAAAPTYSAYPLYGDWPLTLWDSEQGTAVAGAYIKCAEGIDSQCDCRQPNYAGKTDCTLGVDGGATVSGGAYALSTIPNALDTAIDGISKVFAAVYRTYDWSSGSRYDEATSVDDRRAQYVTKATAPQVRPVLTGNCAAEGLCAEGSSEGMTINDVSSGDIIAQTRGKFTATIKYYAFADKDRMPIRRRQVDFGDKTSNDPAVNSPGWYKNRRGCDPTKGRCTIANAYCDSLDQWGLTSESCESRYFQEVHTYNCTDALVSSLPSCSADGTFPCTDGTHCVYRPRVQITDNWGVCNGTCPGGADGGDACINENFSQMLRASNTNDGCFLLDDSNYYPRGTGNRLNRPWTEYAGAIRLLPPAP